MITRVVFNFTGRCNMQCPFCYVPFDGAHATESEVLHSFDIMLTKLQPLSVTIGGGDPSAFSKLNVLLRTARERTQHVQLDTNGKGLDYSRLAGMAGDIDLLGLPLEGPTPNVHDSIRREAGHFAQVLHTLIVAKDLGIPLKVNTVVMRCNDSHIADLAALVQSVGAAKWSLYEFWAMEPVPDLQDDFYISQEAFESAVTRARQGAPAIAVESGSVVARSPGYIFVRHTGGVYVVAADDSHRYLELGTVFDDAILQRIVACVDLTTQKTRIHSRMGL